MERAHNPSHPCWHQLNSMDGTVNRRKFLRMTHLSLLGSILCNIYFPGRGAQFLKGGMVFGSGSDITKDTSNMLLIHRNIIQELNWSLIWCYKRYVERPLDTRKWNIIQKLSRSLIWCYQRYDERPLEAKKYLIWCYQRYLEHDLDARKWCRWW